MRLSRLYFKMFLAYLAVLVCAEITVLAMIMSGGPPPPFVRTVAGHTNTATRLLERELANFSGSDEALARRTVPLLALLSEEYRGELWLTDVDGGVVAKTFDGPVRFDVGAIKSEPIPTEVPVTLYPVHEKDFRSIYMESTVHRGSGVPLTLHILLDHLPRKEETWFFNGLLILTALSAVFIFPVARMITRPILSLTEAAVSLGRGDFSTRVPVKGKDEVAVLADKFNTMADSLEAMIGTGKELTAHLSHALRTPLARMRVSLQILMERRETGAVGNEDRFLHKIRDEIENMDTIIGEILDLSKLDLQGPLPREDSVDVNRVLESLVGKYEHLIERKGYRVETTLSANGLFTCNASALDVMLENIMSNAMKYTPVNGTIRVDTARDRHGISISVHNSHPPLTDRELTDMMVPFTRLQRDNEPGTGLGLATVEKLAGMHGGEIVATYAGDSVCLTLFLPDTPRNGD